jgi:hypothetical protein
MVSDLADQRWNSAASISQGPVILASAYRYQPPLQLTPPFQRITCTTAAPDPPNFREQEFGRQHSAALPPPSSYPEIIIHRRQQDLS